MNQGEERRTLVGIVEGIRTDKEFIHGWCPVCHKNWLASGHDKDCSLKAAIKFVASLPIMD